MPIREKMLHHWPKKEKSIKFDSKAEKKTNRNLFIENQNPNKNTSIETQ